MPGTAARPPGRRSLAARRARLAASAPPRARATPTPAPVSAEAGADAVTVALDDGRTVSFPVAWSPRLLYGTAAERAEVEVSGYGLHWPQLDEDLSVAGILAGRRSGEEPSSVAAWRAHVDRRRAQIAAGEEPEPFGPALPLPDWWGDDAP